MNPNNQNKIIEQEFRFLIDKNKLKIKPPRQIEGFELLDSSVIKIEDNLFEREGLSLKEENIGFRIRKIDNDKIEFTYKKFLGRDNNMVRYDEFTIEINQNEADELKSNVFTNPKLPILVEMTKKGKLYYFVTINNKRDVYHYKNNDSSIELVIEDVLYSNGNNKAPDSALEIEIKATNERRDNVDKFVNNIKELYECKVLNEGKNARAMRLLNITLR